MSKSEIVDTPQARFMMALNEYMRSIDKVELGRWYEYSANFKLEDESKITTCGERYIEIQGVVNE